MGIFTSETFNSLEDLFLYELKDLYVLSPLRAIGAVASTWALIAAAVGLALWSHNAVFWIAAAVIVGRSQHALAVHLDRYLGGQRLVNGDAGQAGAAQPECRQRLNMQPLRREVHE